MINVTARIKQGHLEVHQEAEWAEELNKLNGRTVEILVRPINLRSQKQNKYYWGTLIYMIWSDLVSKGWRADDLDPLDYQGSLTKNHVHEYMRYKFLEADVFNAVTEEVEGTEFRSTKGLSTTEFMTYVEDIREWAVTALDLDIPDPNEIA